MSLLPPAEGWFDKKISKDEKMWVAIAFVLCLLLFAWMVLWHVFGNQNPSNTTYRTTPEEFSKLHSEYIKKHLIGMDAGIPVVAPEPNSDVPLLAEMWRWSPVLVLVKEEWYNLHITSKDLVHGFSLQPTNMNFQVYPFYDYVLKFKPTQSGEFKVVCNEFCGIGHHAMLGKIIVVDSKDDIKNLKLESTATAATTEGPAAEPGAPVPPEQLAKLGETVYQLKGCNACHKLDGTSQLAPSFKGIYGTKVNVKSGGKAMELTIDDAYIASSVREPQKHIVAGFENLQMPVTPLDDDEILQVTEFIKSQKN